MRNNATNKSLAEACIRTAQSDNLLLQPLDSLLELGDLICRHGSERLAMAKWNVLLLLQLRDPWDAASVVCMKEMYKRAPFQK